jgi:hypothetical protein
MAQRTAILVRSEIGSLVKLYKDATHCGETPQQERAPLNTCD